jgi:hypothetical protein
MLIRTLRYLSALTLLAPLAACSGTPDAEPSGSPDTHVDPLTYSVYVNPCDPTWRLPTKYWPYLNPSAYSLGETFYDFEKELWYGGSLWFGRAGSTFPVNRTIVRVNHYAASSPFKPPKSALWYLALIPYVPAPDPPTATMLAVGTFETTEPVESHIFGYCLDDNSFLPNMWDAAGPQVPTYAMPQGHKIIYSVTEYDPRCTCSGSASVTTSAAVGDGLYNSIRSTY